MKKRMQVCIVVFGALTVFFSAFLGMALADLSTGLFAHFKFEQNITDSSPSNFSGTLYNNLTYVPGVMGSYAASFDGKAFIAFPTQYLYPLYDGTINLFFQASPDFNYDAHIMGVKTNYKTEIGFGLNPLNYAGTPISTGKWYMVTHVYSNGGSPSGSEKVYLNGSLIREEINYRNNGYIGDWAYPDNPYYSVIGQGAAGPVTIDSAKFKGLVDDIRIYSRALSTSEIQELYNLSSTAVPLPGAFWLLGSGLIGLVGLRKRFSR